MTGSRLRPARWSLRARLVAALLALLAAVSVVIGLVSVTALRKQVTSQVDRQLSAAGNRSVNAEGFYGHGGPPVPAQDASCGGPDFLNRPGQGSGTLGAQIVNGTVTSAAILNGDNDCEPLNAADTATLASVRVDAEPHTVNLGPLGDYRVLASSDPDGDGTVVLTGLPLKDAQSTVYNLTLVISIVSAIGLLRAAVAGSLIVRFALRPLRRVADTATRVSHLPLDRGEVALRERVPEADTDTRTEVGQVGAALNSLLGHVATALTARQASEMRVRQFVADASHELRTPLASIRGYAELTRRTREELPHDVSHAMTRVESEATRMTGLVEDLLLLARLDAGRPIEAVPVDLTALVIDAVSDAHAAAENQPIRLLLPDEPVEVTGDPARLHQVFANLLSNARTHTAPGTPVTVIIRRAECSEDSGPPNGAADLAAAHPSPVVCVEVADEGPGISPELLPHVFERFARADSSRSRTAGSTGLGLAIVEAVVAAHGGRVGVRTRPGRTAFTVELPLRLALLPT